jgi:hypothetical protein
MQERGLGFGMLRGGRKIMGRAERLSHLRGSCVSTLWLHYSVGTNSMEWNRRGNMQRDFGPRELFPETSLIFGLSITVIKVERPERR